MDYLIKNGSFEALVEQEKSRVKLQILEQYKELRRDKGMTQQQIADITGIKRTNIVRIESGKYVPTIEVLVKLAAALDMDLEIRLVKKRE